MIVELGVQQGRVPPQLLHPPQPRRGHAQDRVLHEGCEMSGVPWIDQVWVLYLGVDLDEVS